MNKFKVFNYEISPKTIKRGTQWLSLNLENISETTLFGVEVKLNSLTPFFISVMRPESYISKMNPDDIEHISFQIEANESGKVYVTANGNLKNSEFYWDSPPIKLDVKDQSAEIKSVFILSQPKVPAHKLISAEAIIKSLKPRRSYKVLFWQNSPSGYEKIGESKTDLLQKGEEKSYKIDFTPSEPGIHEIHVYLYENDKLLSREYDSIVATN